MVAKHHTLAYILQHTGALIQKMNCYAVTGVCFIKYFTMASSQSASSTGTIRIIMGPLYLVCCNFELIAGVSIPCKGEQMEECHLCSRPCYV